MKLLIKTSNKIMSKCSLANDSQEARVLCPWSRNIGHKSLRISTSCKVHRSAFHSVFTADRKADIESSLPPGQLEASP